MVRCIISEQGDGTHASARMQQVVPPPGQRGANPTFPDPRGFASAPWPPVGALECYGDGLLTARRVKQALLHNVRRPWGARWSYLADTIAAIPCSLPPYPSCREQATPARHRQMRCAQRAMTSIPSIETTPRGSIHKQSHEVVRSDSLPMTNPLDSSMNEDGLLAQWHAAPCPPHPRPPSSSVPANL